MINEPENYECEPEMLNLIESGGTQEGQTRDAKFLKIANFGSYNVVIDEGGKYLANANRDDERFLGGLYKAYDGEFSTKSIKSEQKLGFLDISGIPANVLLASTPNILKRELNQKTEGMLDDGLGRRPFTLFDSSNKRTYTRRTLSEKEEIIKNIKDFGQKLFAKFKEIKHGSNFAIPEEVNALHEDYLEYLIELSNTTTNDILTAEILSRGYKSYKIACLIASFKHPQDTKITLDDCKQGIQITEMLSTDLKRFLNYQPDQIDPSDKVFEFLKSNLNIEFTKTELTTKKYKEIGIKKAYFRSNFDTIMLAVIENADIDGYILVENESYTNGCGYKLVSKKKNNDEIKGLEELL